MRTTLTLNDEAAEIAKRFAQANGVRLGEAVSRLILQSQGTCLPLRREGELWVYDAPSDAPRVTMEMVKQLLEDFP